MRFYPPVSYWWWANKKTFAHPTWLCSSTKEIDAQLIFDIEHDHYQLVDVGWQNQKRIHSCFLHLDIKDGKVWIQHNGTEDHIAYDLVAKGIPKEDIVLGFQAPDYRQYTDFAVN